MLSLLSAVLSMGSMTHAYDLYVTGHNTYGQLGQGHNAWVENLTFVRSGVAQAAFSNRTGFILLENGDLYSAGAWSYGGLGRGAAEAAGDPDYFDPHWGFVMSGVRQVSTKGSGYGVLVITTDNRLLGAGVVHDWRYGDTYWQPEIGWTADFVEVATDVAMVAASESTNTYGYTAWVTLTGDLYLVGAPWPGSYSTGSSDWYYTPHLLDTNVRSVVTGYNRTTWVKNDNTLWGVGYALYNAYGVAGLETAQTPVLIASNVASTVNDYNRVGWLDLNGTAWHLGDSSFFYDSGAMLEPSTVPYQMGTGVSTLVFGMNHTFLIYPDGTMDVSGIGLVDQLTFGPEDYGMEGFTRSPLERVANIAQSVFNTGFLVSPAPQDPVDPTPAQTHFERTETRKLTTVTNAYWRLDPDNVLAGNAQWQVVGALPKGFRLENGSMRGQIGEAGVYRFEVEGTDGTNHLKVSYAVTVVSPTMTPLISDVICNGISHSTEVLEGPTHGNAAVTGLINFHLKTGIPLEITFNWDMQKPGYSWRIVGGELPQGLTLNGDTGAITGIPGLPGEYYFVVSVKDWRGRAYQWLRLVVN